MSRAYQANKIFADTGVNNLIDVVFSHMEKRFPPAGHDPDNGNLFKNFALSGKPALILQGRPDELLKNIPFEVYGAELYNALRQDLQSITGGRVVKLEKCLLLYKNNVYYEFWVSEGIKALSAQNVYVQDKLFIPGNLS